MIVIDECPINGLSLGVNSLMVPDNGWRPLEKTHNSYRTWKKNGFAKVF